MDDKLDLSSLAQSDGAVGDAVSKLLSRPDLIMNIAKELGLSGSPLYENQNEDTSPVKKQPEEHEQKNVPAVSEKKEFHGERKKLLLALRPYLSERRREALDMMINLESVGSLVGKIDPSVIMKFLGGDKNV